MYVLANKKALSTITVILLIIMAAVAGGIISYAFTIAAYVKLPDKTTLVITGIYLDRENVTSLKISVLNPSYSPTEATIYGIALNIRGETELYYALETYPSIRYGIVVPIGESVNITCSYLKKGDSSISLGEFIGEFIGKTVIVHVLSSDSSASNIEAVLPNARINVTTSFNPQISLKNFSITLTNEESSEVDLTINAITFADIEIEEISPDVNSQPITVRRNSSLRINLVGDWAGLNKTTVKIFTQQGYIFTREIELQG